MQILDNSMDGYISYFTNRLERRARYWCFRLKSNATLVTARELLHWHCNVFKLPRQILFSGNTASLLILAHLVLSSNNVSIDVFQ